MFAAMPTMITTQDDVPPGAAPKAKGSRDRLAERCEVMAAALALVPALILFLAVVGFATGHSLQAWYAPVAVAAGMLFAAWRTRVTGESVLLAALLAGVMAVSLWLGARIGDTSYDSINYHQSAVSELRHGWNPWHGQSSGRFASERTWVDNYPQASWINAAAASLVTDRIDSGKWLNFAYTAVSFLAVFSVLLRTTAASVTASLALAMLAAANPVTLCQLNTFYVDGVLASSVVVLIAGLWLVSAAGRASGWWLVAPALLLLINFKHTGAAYGAFSCAGAVAVRVWRVNWRQGISTGIGLLAIGLAGVAFLGYAPYGKNIINGRHIFHPVLGAKRIENFMGDRKTPNLPGNRVLDFVMSQFARSDYPEHVARPAAGKFPLMVYPSELATWYSPDVKSGGYGPWYGALIVASAGGLAGLIYTRRKLHAYTVLGLGAVVATGVFCHEYAWWARYAPQGWLFACIVPAVILDLPGRPWRWFRICVLGMGLANSAVILVVSSVTQSGFNMDLERNLSAAAKSAPVALRLDRFPVLAERFRERGIPCVLAQAEAPAGVDRQSLLRGNPAVYWFKQP